MPIVKSLIKLPLTVGKLSLLIGGAGGYAFAQGVAKGSIIELEEDQNKNFAFSTEVLEQRQTINVDVELSDEALFKTAGASMAVYLSVSAYLARKLQVRERFVALAATIDFIIGSVERIQDALQKAESVAIDGQIEIDKMLNDPDIMGEEVFRKIDDIQRKTEMQIVFAVDEGAYAKGAIRRLEALSNARYPLSEIEPKMRVGDLTDKQMRRAAKLIFDDNIDKKLQGDIDLYQFMFGYANAGKGDEIWDLTSLVSNFDAQLGALSSALAKGSETITEGKKAANTLVGELGSGILAADDSMNTTIDNLFLQTTESTLSQIRGATEYSNDLDNALIRAKTVSDNAIDVGTKIGGKAISRGLSFVSVVDGVYWLTTSAIDIGLNFTGIAEEDQRIPFLADIPVIGKVFDFGENKLGGSFIDDLIITPILDFALSPFLPEEVEVALSDSLLLAISVASQVDSLQDCVATIVNWYADEINADFEFPFAQDKTVMVESPNLLKSLATFDPLVVLEVMLYAVVAKIVFNAWIRPAYGYFSRNTGLGSTA